MCNVDRVHHSKSIAINGVAQFVHSMLLLLRISNF